MLKARKQKKTWIQTIYSDSKNKIMCRDTCTMQLQIYIILNRLKSGFTMTNISMVISKIARYIVCFPIPHRLMPMLMNATCTSWWMLHMNQHSTRLGQSWWHGVPVSRCTIHYPYSVKFNSINFFVMPAWKSFPQFAHIKTNTKLLHNYYYKLWKIVIIKKLLHIISYIMRVHSWVIPPDWSKLCDMVSL